MIQSVRTWSLELALCIALCVATGAAHSQTSLLDQPAQVFARASGSVLMAVSRLPGPRLVAVGERGVVLLSDDDGVSWRQAQVPVSVALTNVRFVSEKRGWAIGHGGVVLSSIDGGATWTKQLDGAVAAALELSAAESDPAARTEAGQRRLAEARRLMEDGPDKPLFDVYFRDEDNGLVVGAYGLIFATADGGRTWTSLKGRLDNPRGKHLYSIGAEGGSLYLAGEQGAFFRSSDGGRSFIEVTTPYAGTWFGVLPVPPRGVVLYGLRGNAYRSMDQGHSWQKIDAGPPVSLTAGIRLADGSVVLVDESGRVLRSRDEARTFEPMDVPGPYPFTGVAVAADGSLIVTGARGVQRIASHASSTRERRP